MPRLNGSNSPPAEILGALYGEDGSEDEHVSDDENAYEALFEEDDDEEGFGREGESDSPVAPPYSPLTFPRRREPVPAPDELDLDWDRERERSPLMWRAEETVPASDQLDPMEHVRVGIFVFDEHGVQQDLVDLDPAGQEYMDPDAHALYGRPGMIDDERTEMREGVADDRGATEDGSERDMRARAVRSRSRGRRGARTGGRRGRGVGGGRRRKEGVRMWEVGHPLEEIWVTDDDVPLELRELAMDVVRRRQRRAEESRTSGRSTHERRRIKEEDTSESEEGEDVFHDAADGNSNSPGLVFDWSPMETFQGREEIFMPESTGSVDSYASPYDAFRSYWDENILQVIVEKTNRYALKITSPSFQADWFPTNSHEILCLFAFWMMLGIIRMPTIQSCFSTYHLLKTDVFRHILTRKRYSNLVRALYFVDTDPSYNAASVSNSGIIPASSDPIHLLRPIIDHLNAKFQANYVPSKDICIDESLTLWKGRLNIKQYIRSKAARFGIKTFELCESATGYLWSVLVYTGKHNSFLPHDPTVLKSTAVVKKLIAPLLNKGYRLFMDNWYNTPLLARFLKSNGTDCIGTLNSCRQDFPSIIKTAPLRQGQFVARHAGDLCVLSWQDKNRVNMISTCHGTAMGLATVPSRPPTRPLPFKPQVVLDYNKSMGGVDLKDQMLEPYLIERKRCAKWYMKLFKRLLNVSILNSRILLEHSSSSTQTQTDKTREDHLQFRLHLVDSIIAQHLPHCPKSRRATTAFARSSSHVPAQFNHTHWPVSIPPTTARAASNRKGRSGCAVCAKNSIRRWAAFKCSECDVPLCVENCFRIHHTSTS